MLEASVEVLQLLLRLEELAQFFGMLPFAHSLFVRLQTTTATCFVSAHAARQNADKKCSPQVGMQEEG